MEEVCALSKSNSTQIFSIRKAGEGRFRVYFPTKSQLEKFCSKKKYTDGRIEVFVEDVRFYYLVRLEEGITGKNLQKWFAARYTEQEIICVDLIFVAGVFTNEIKVVLSKPLRENIRISVDLGYGKSRQISCYWEARTVFWNPITARPGSEAEKKHKEAKLAYEACRKKNLRL